MIQHFSHEHHLEFCTAKKEGGVVCEGCRLPILGQCYGCNGCGFYLDISCAELSQDLVHPFHPQHSLKLHAKFPPSDDACRPSCNACGELCMGFTFYCSESSCGFAMDINCITLDIPPNRQFSRYSDQHIRHQHHLILCDNEKNSELFFSCCGRRDRKGSAYVCLQCPCLLHISCSELGKEIEHPFHPQHLLILVPTSSANNEIRRVFFCNACGSRCSPITFCCSECDFVLDVYCASLMLMPTKSINEGEGGHHHQPNTIQHFTHPHPLIVCGFDKKTNFARTCYACDLPFEEASVVHVCLECGLLLHDSCPDLPQVINHPFHPPHQLTLRSPFDSGPPHHVNLRSPFDFGPFMESCCRVCLKPPTRWKYGCDKCDLTIDSRCALLPYVRDTRIHHHPLVYFTNSTTGPSNFCCHACFKIQCTPFLRCVEYNCYFEVHISCIPKLPLTLKHKYHRHALTLTNSPIKDHPDEDEDAEFYCDTCEERRVLADRSYYCAECHYVAHVGCVMSFIQ